MEILSRRHRKLSLFPRALMKSSSENRWRNRKQLSKLATKLACITDCPEQACESRTALFHIPELLGVIFELCLPENDLPTDSPLAPPVLFTHVCRMWRQVAIATPRLWAGIRMLCFPSVPSRTIADRHLGVLTNWLARSGACPISLKLRYLGGSKSDFRSISMILAAILPHAKRWRHLDITAPLPCLVPILQLLGKNTPFLETCRFTITSGNMYSELEDLVFDRQNRLAFRMNALPLDLTLAPSLQSLILKTDAHTDVVCAGLPPTLRSLSLNNIDLLPGGPPGLNLSFQCKNLRTLVLQTSMSVSFMRMLGAAFPQLEDACFNVKHEVYTETPMDIARNVTAFPRLHTLTLRAVSSSGEADLRTLGIFLDVLYLPALVQLSLIISFALEAQWPHLAHNLARSRPPLAKLSIEGMCLSEDVVLNILREVPHLVSLKLCVRLTDRGLEELTLPETQLKVDNQNTGNAIARVCPYLARLDIPIASPCSSDAVIAMLLSRRSSGLTECRLVLSEPGCIEQIECCEDIKRYVVEGLRLDLRRF
ncbi:hypothetical protein DFH11DRAFT_1592853 [Phellopilus nigrolimitatus]|nr:hypothetical protein DFH11DRAFT_1592853 [Phellopilus nigrolimitatus]